MGHILGQIFNRLIDNFFRPLYNIFRFFPRLFNSRKKHPGDQLPPILHDDIGQSPRELSQHEDESPALDNPASEGSKHEVQPQIIEDLPREQDGQRDGLPAMTPDDQMLFDSHTNLPGIGAGELDEMAHSYTQLAVLFSKYGSQDYKKCIRSASNIYDAAAGQYFEEKLTMLNNVALNLQSLHQHAQAVQLYQEAISLADLYLPISDHRAIIIKNNLACALIANGEQQKGQEMLHLCSEAAKSISTHEGLTGLIQNNIRFHGVQPHPPQVNLLSDEICV